MSEEDGGDPIIGGGSPPLGSPAHRKRRLHRSRIKMSSDWYPKTLAELVAWHANFTVQAVANGTTLGLTALQVTQIGVDSGNVANIVNYIFAVDAYAQSVTQFKDLMLEGDIGIALPTAPTAPTAPSLAPGSLASIQARTRQYANIIKASPNYTAEQGEHYGIVAAASGGPSTPSVAAVALTGSQIQLNIAKAGYDVVAIDSKRGTGGWEFLGISMTETYIDSRAPLTAGAPEVREYRVQGMQSNSRVGALSGVASAVSVP